MPLHTASLSRRSFLQHSVAGAAGLMVLQTGWGAEPGSNPHQLALLSDTHIPASADVVARDTNMTANLQQVVREVLELQVRPAGVLINGDCAYLKGLPEDYANFAGCLQPILDARLPVHVTMGNHDAREPLFAAFKAQRPDRPLLDERHVTVIEMPHANWFLLDSLIQTNLTPGELGPDQRSWLARALSERRDKPALVVAHHTPQFEPPAEGKAWGGLKDTAEFIEMLKGFAHVKAFIFGHSHVWASMTRDGLNLVNLPPVAYVFAAERPNGWVLADVHEHGLDLTLNCLNRSHSQHGEKLKLRWS